jgi:hypothetical protein
VPRNRQKYYRIKKTFFSAEAASSQAKARGTIFGKPAKLLR